MQAVGLKEGDNYHHKPLGLPRMWARQNGWVIDSFGWHFSRNTRLIFT